MQCVNETINLANQKLNQSFPIPQIIYRHKGSVGGTAHLTEWIIKLNTQLLIEHQKPFIDEVIPHELAHLFVFALYGRVKPHGQEWQSIMCDILGKVPKRTHQFTNSMLEKTRIPYQCGCQTHYLTKIRHQKIQQKKLEYICKRCNNSLKLHNN
ncbi:SprT family zinc-dependent metalloprotease [Utexia brackfieldae]|uniref:SprT family zinc-dependent metalloprotease n=1 Tax=Utexia brackfieldae TaxID=3074108 RepID=UPI00370D86D6